MSAVRPSGVITLLTDFGLGDPFVGVMKGVILDRYPEAKIVDLTHGIAPHDIAEASFWLSRSYRSFSEGTVHVAVVDPGVGTERAAVGAEVDGHYFLAPDNGLLGAVIARARVGRGSTPTELRVVEPIRLGIDPPSRTFHGRDVFAPVAAELAAGRRWLSEVGPSVTRLVPTALPAAVVDESGASGVVVTVDRFGNLITNLDAELLDRVRAPVVLCAGRRFPIRGTYQAVTRGAYLALVNAFGVVELARSEGSAADGLGVGKGAVVEIRDGEAE